LHAEAGITDLSAHYFTPAHRRRPVLPELAARMTGRE
jgi:hypothetical protein